VKHLQSVIKRSQKQIIQIQREISALERSREKEFAKLRTQIRVGRGALILIKDRVAKNKRKRKKIR
jgi:hypothetical protein